MIDPKSIPEHFVKVALGSYFIAPSRCDDEDRENMAQAIADVLDALMTNAEPVYVDDVEAEEGETYKHWVRPSDVLDELLHREPATSPEDRR